MDNGNVSGDSAMNQKIIKPTRMLTMQEAQNMQINTINSLKHMSVRAHLLGCELQRVDPKNDIFNMNEGILDKEHLYHIRKALQDGQYDKNREIAREAFN